MRPAQSKLTNAVDWAQHFGLNVEAASSQAAPFHFSFGGWPGKLPAHPSYVLDRLARQVVPCPHMNGMAERGQLAELQPN
jgi:hypothetical protein